MKPLWGRASRDSSRLRFDCEDDALHFIRNFSECGNHWLAFQGMNPLEQYIKGNVDLVLQVRTASEAHVFDFVFRSVPMAVAELASPHQHALGSSQRVSDRSGPDRDNYAVGVGVPYLVQPPKQGIPSLVWIEPSQERTDFRWIVGEPFTAEFAFDAGGIFGKGKSRSLWGAPMNRDGACVDSMIERIAKAAGRVLNNNANLAGQLGSKPDFVNFLSRLSIGLDYAGVRLRIEESGDALIGVFNLVSSMADQEFRTIERATHGKTPER